MSKITLITGGSRGIGAAAARLAAARGHRVAYDVASESEAETLFETVAEGILWLLDHATYSTGTFLDIAGGR